jgi:hypothetical protein
VPSTSRAYRYETDIFFYETDIFCHGWWPLMPISMRLWVCQAHVMFAAYYYWVAPGRACPCEGISPLRFVGARPAAAFAAFLAKRAIKR